MRRKKTVFFVESPLQLVSVANKVCQSDESILIFRDTNPQLERLVKSLCPLGSTKIFKVDSLFGLILRILQIKLSSRVIEIGVGDFRSFYSIILLGTFRSQKTILYDDGSYSIGVDQGQDPFINVRVKFIKSWFIRRVLARKNLGRSSLFAHPISREYESIVRDDLKVSLKRFSVNGEVADDDIFSVSEPALYYVESCLKGWVPDAVEASIYSSLQNYCKTNKLKLIIICHRRVVMARLNYLTSHINDFKIVKLEYPIEFYYPAMDSEIHTVAFPITSAFRTAINIFNFPKVIRIEIEGSKFIGAYRAFAANFYESCSTEVQACLLRTEVISI